MSVDYDGNIHTGERHPLKQGLKLLSSHTRLRLDANWRKTSTKTRIETQFFIHIASATEKTGERHPLKQGLKLCNSLAY